jgi:two-component system, chemotaxis family, sensor kinase CheA
MITDDAVKEFLVESHENLDQLDRDFVSLESDPGAKDKIGGIFRTIHTIKGNSGFFGYNKLEQLAHAGESLLSLLRDGELTLTPTMVSALLTMVDRIRGCLRSIEETETEGTAVHDDVVKLLKAARTSVAAAPAPPTKAAPLEPSSAVGATTKAAPDAPPPDAPAPVLAAPEPAPPEPAADPPPAISHAVEKLAPKIAIEPAAPPVPLPLSMNAAPPSRAGATNEPTAPRGRDEGTSTSVSDTNVRVDVSLLDKLMNLVGELVLSRNQIVRFGTRLEEVAGAAQRLNLITTELQEHVMKTRMQPIGNVWSKLPRVVRDLAVTCGKQVRVEMMGKETDLDRTILEAIKDPLTHIVRNSVDHGIETPDVRAAKGKPRTGTLTLRAYHEGGQVNIEISDDGAGVNAVAVRRKAIERNLVTAERADQMTENELIQLVFLPGFSTAEKISNVSGRGVGMDVVKTNIERIGGSVDLRGAAGRGTTIHIKIPLTLAIVPALVISSGGERYAIPQVSLLELVRLEGATGRHAIERIHGTPVYRLRGKLLPIVFLNEQLSLPDGLADVPDQCINIVVLQADGRQFGLVVDDVRDTEEIVVKPLGKELKGVSVFAGATIMGDGRVALILDVLGLGQHSGAVRGTRDAAGPHLGTTRAAAGATDAVAPTTLLLFTVSDEREMAIPLEMVARLEEFPRDRVEVVGRRRVVQYRGEILPLIDLPETLGTGPGAADTLQVIVYTEDDRSVGFVVGRILDVVDETVHVQRSSSQQGVLGAAIVQGKVTEILDVAGLVRAHDPSFGKGRAA